jgi:uncharacterized protein (TIGR03032 family)
MSDSPPSLALHTSRGFTAWLAEAGGALAFTTYQAGKLFLLGVRPDGKLSVFERSFPRCMGLSASADGRTLLLATQGQLYRFDNILPDGERQGDFDAAYAPRQTWITGDLDIHDVAFGADGPLFVNTLFSCLATLSEGHSFRPLWRPPFVSRLAAEDRCHLNGMAMENGQPRHVTCISRSDVADGWRDHRRDGGMVVDVVSGEVVVEGLSMPHSPRLRDGRLWLLNSGTGDFGWVDTASGTFTPLAFCPGYARGLSLVGRYAIIGLSRPRDNRTFSGLPLDEALARRGAEARCGLLVVDLESGDTVEWVRIEGVVSELYDVVFLPGTRCPSAIGLKGQEILKVINVDDEGV